MKITGYPKYKKINGVYVIESGFNAVKSGYKLEILPGDITNFASIPFPFSLIFDYKDEAIVRASIMHDMLVGEFMPKRKVKHINNGVEVVLTWKQSAVWFREAMRHDGTDKLRRRAFYHAVMSWKRIKRLF